MKKLKLCLASLVVFSMIFTSCSKDEPEIDSTEKASLSFGAIVNDLMNKSSIKQVVDGIPACTDDTPAFVRVVLMQDGAEVVGSEAEPYRVDLVSGEIFTEDDPALELDPGTYSLSHFSVYNSDEDLIWIAPRLDSELANFVDGALPLSINLGAGVKKYVDVPVLCFDDRDVNQYGYLFFELQPVEAYELCFFANYCDDDGRHYTANYSINVWLGTDNTGTLLYSDLQPETGIDENGDFFANPVCMALPINEDPDEDYIYYEATVLDWDENYDSPASFVRTGTLSRNDIEGNFRPDMTLEYEHLYFNCAGEGEEPTGPTCLPALTGDCERVTFTQSVTNEGLPAGQDPSYPLFTADNDEVGTITYELIKRPGTRDLLIATVELDEGWSASDANFTLPNVDEDDVCINNIFDDEFDMVYEAMELNYPVQARVVINVCPEP